MHRKTVQIQQFPITDQNIVHINLKYWSTLNSMVFFPIGLVLKLLIYPIQMRCRQTLTFYIQKNYNNFLTERKSDINYVCLREKYVLVQLYALSSDDFLYRCLTIDLLSGCKEVFLLYMDPKSLKLYHRSKSYRLYIWKTLSSSSF